VKFMKTVVSKADYAKLEELEPVAEDPAVVM
jgi:hypothetical protein